MLSSAIKRQAQVQSHVPFTITLPMDTSTSKTTAPKLMDRMIRPLFKPPSMRLRLWAGEWFADTSVGVPWLLFLGVKGAQALAESTLRRAITTCPGVASLDAFTFTLNTRTRAATLSFRVTAATGDVLAFSDFVAGEDATSTGARVLA